MQKQVITIKEVAEYANVSQATVSRVINGQNSVKEKNLEKVKKRSMSSAILPTQPQKHWLVTAQTVSVC